MLCWVSDAQPAPARLTTARHPPGSLPTSVVKRKWQPHSQRDSPHPALAPCELLGEVSLSRLCGRDPPGAADGRPHPPPQPRTRPAPAGRQQATPRGELMGAVLPPPHIHPHTLPVAGGCVRVSRSSCAMGLRAAGPLRLPRGAPAAAALV